MTTQEKIDLLLDIQERMLDLIGQLKVVADGDGWAESYIVAPIEIAVSENHPWLSRDPNIDSWIRQLEDED